MAGEPIFTKRRAGAPRGLFAWEAAGLGWLAEATAEGGAAVVEVLDFDEHHLSEPELVPGLATVEAAEDFGRALARTHLFGAPGFGAAPTGWQGDGFIGDALLPMPSAPMPRWGEFYANFRVLPFARRAFDAGSLDAASLDAVERACARLVDGDFDDDRPAARIHGDLWAGNLQFTRDGAVLIDPAAHGGHAETDLAMLDLFGAPHLRRLGDAWAEAWGAGDGWRERTALHQLHPLLVHAVLFGGGYGAQAGSAARRLC
ncbi:fructosamine kinase family protein [Luteococcus sediminum]|uniref:fructosamine kinase family protein n=1 Tax=Luteococcus sp. TaxID=1969402 RepID=UPI003736C27C